MPFSTTNKRKAHPLEGCLLRFIRNRLQDDPRAASDPAELYRRALGDLVDSLLGDEVSEFEPGLGIALGDGRDCDKENRPQSMSAEQIGEAYERLRGFRVEITAEKGPMLVSAVMGKRNQGLFYTPPAIVRHIVASTLDALQITRPSDYLDLKVLDPAVGTGTFLTEALEQLAGCILPSNSEAGDGVMRRASAEPVKRNEDHPESDAETAIRMHILENCLYGIDLDPVALKIARSALAQRALSGQPGPGTWAGDHLRVGNALIGEPLLGASFPFTEEWNGIHAKAYLGRDVCSDAAMEDWRRTKSVFHWPSEFPEVASSGGGGFHAVIGNPPYEIVSVKESGIEERRLEQRYFRRMYRACSGKINTYRLMLERGLDLLADRGALGFIVPATLLADSTAAPLRKMLLDGFSINQCVVIPEKAHVFEEVTQAFAIMVVRKDRVRGSVFPVVWHGTGPIPRRGEVEISRGLIDSTGLRIPILKSEEEKELLEHLSKYPPFKGDENTSPVGIVHQGEINLTVHRRFITDRKTVFPLIRGEHVQPFWVQHPTPGKARLDWISPELPDGPGPSSRSTGGKKTGDESGRRQSIRTDSWRKERIVVGRVVNMDTTRRLKAAPVPPGFFLGDMTNSISDFTVPRAYLLGLLNSRLLNWRFKLTSTNNYISAAEIKCLPIPRIPDERIVLRELPSVQAKLDAFPLGPHGSAPQYMAGFRACFAEELLDLGVSFMAAAIECLVEGMPGEFHQNGRPRNELLPVLDSLVMLLYGVESAAGIQELWES